MIITGSEDFLQGSGWHMGFYSLANSDSEARTGSCLCCGLGRGSSDKHAQYFLDYFHTG